MGSDKSAQLPLDVSGDNQLKIVLQIFCDDLVGTWYTRDLRRAPEIVYGQDLRCVSLPVLLSFKWGWEECLLSWLSGPPLPFQFSSLMHLPAHLCSFNSLPPIFHSFGSVLLRLSLSLALPLCPCDSHGLALPSALLTLPTPTGQPGLCYYLCRQKPCWAFSHHTVLWPVPQLVCKHCAPDTGHMVVTMGSELQYKFIAY